MFANLIPGMREVRAPLAAGAILVLAIAIAIEPEIPDKETATGLLASFIAVGDGLGPFGRGAAAAFVAYLLGSVVQGGSGWFASQFSFSRQPVGKTIFLPAGLGLQVFADDKVLTAEAELESASGKNLREMAEDGALAQAPLFRLFEHHVRTDGRIPPKDSQKVSTLLAVSISSELAIVHRRLLGVEPEWSGEVDRFEAEAELREAIALPLLILGAVCSFRIADLLVAAGVFVGIAAFTTGLLYQGSRRRWQAEETLIDALRVGRVQAPALERFEAGVRSLLVAQRPPHRGEASSIR
jgi:hypothetical protein